MIYSAALNQIPGKYLLEVLSTTHMYSQVKLDVSTSAKYPGVIRALEYKYPGAPKQQMKLPLMMNAHVQTRYFEVKPDTMSIGSFLSNPMSFMMIMTLGIIVVFPQMIKNMDPEAMKEMQEQMANSQVRECVQQEGVSSVRECRERERERAGARVESRGESRER
jgi:hypothetical protein